MEWLIFYVYFSLNDFDLSFIVNGGKMTTNDVKQMTINDWV